MFDNGANMPVEASPCKPDYEHQAARLKKRIADAEVCLYGMEVGLSSGVVDLYREQGALYYAVIGSLHYWIPRWKNEYEKLLEMMEKKA